jgi:hypothetical protein
VVLTLDDLPDGWELDPDEGDDESVPGPLDDCDTSTSEGRTGRAESEDFFDGVSAALQNRVSVFEDEEAVVSSLESFDGVAECVADGISEGALNNDEIEFSDASVSDLDLGAVGDERRGYRIEATATNPENEEDTVDVYFDVALVVVGRIGVALLVADVVSPFDDLDTIIDIAVGKAEDALDGGGDDGEPTATDGEEDRPTRTPDEGDDDDGDGGVGSSQDNPVPFGDAATIVGRMEVRIVDVNTDAEEIVLAEDPLNEAAEGKNMVLMRLEVTNVGETPLDVFFEPFYFLVGDKGTEYDEFDPSCGLAPDELEGELQPGDSTEGNVCVQADEDDENIVFFIEMLSEATFQDERVYFALD